MNFGRPFHLNQYGWWYNKKQNKHKRLWFYFWHRPFFSCQNGIRTHSTTRAQPSYRARVRLGLGMLYSSIFRRNTHIRVHRFFLRGWLSIERRGVGRPRSHIGAWYSIILLPNATRWWKKPTCALLPPRGAMSVAPNVTEGEANRFCRFRPPKRVGSWQLTYEKRALNFLTNSKIDMSLCTRILSVMFSDQMLLPLHTSCLFPNWDSFVIFHMSNECHCAWR